jgi:outer membrane protein OmpA-like peptidoglycan-associated protein
MVNRLILFLIFSNANHCFSQELIQLVQVDSIAILFENDSSQTLSYRVALNRLKKYAKSNYQLTLKAFTDTKGSKNYNANLSQKRLDFVTEKLTTAKFTNIKSTKSFGEASRSLKSDSLNRRVDIIIERLDTVKLNAKVLLMINFSGGSDMFLTESRPIVIDLGKKLMAFTSISIELHGHVCCENDQELSLKRVERVKKELIKAGIDPKRIEIFGHSNTQPIGDDNTPAGQAKNRRVEVIFKEK